MHKPDRFLKTILATIALFLGIIALRPFFEPSVKAMAQTAKFDHVLIISPVFLYKGQQGLLVLDRRNANIWFFPRVDEQFRPPVFVLRLPFEMLDQTPQ
jgi:hypothetical protein